MTSPRTSRRGLTLIEVVLSLLVVSIMLTAALTAVAASRQTETSAHDRALAGVLADDLLGYVCRLDYRASSGSVFGIEAGDILTDKTTLDDVDDFNGYTESPPADSTNTQIAGLSNWSRSVTVEYVTAADPTVVSAADTGVKRVTVVVKKNGAVLATRCALRANITNP